MHIPGLESLSGKVRCVLGPRQCYANGSDISDGHMEVPELFPGVFCILDLNGCVLRASSTFPQVFQGASARADHTLLAGLVHADDAENLCAAMAKAISGHVTAFVDVRPARASGPEWWSWSFSADCARGIVYGSGHDVTQRKLLEEALRKSAADFRFIAERASDTISRRGMDGAYTYLSPRCEDLIGYTPEEMLGKSPLDFCHPDDKAAVLDLQRQSSEQTSVVSSEYRFRRKDGDYVWLEVTGYALRDPRTGLPVEIMAASRDVTKRKQREQEIARLNQALREKAVALEAVNAELEAFSYSVSHDLRAPLRGIDGFSSALLDDYRDALDETGKDFLNRIRAATQRMGSMIDSLLSLSRLTRKEINRSTVDLSSLAHEVASELESCEPARTVHWNLARGVSDSADALLMRNVFQNLLGNAWKYTRNRSDAVIEFGALDGSGQRTYFVRDNGAGFDARYAAKLFGAFQRLHGQDEFEGIGIGLATVKRIIQRMGGRVWAEGCVGEGATFYFTLSRGGPDS